MEVFVGEKRPAEEEEVGGMGVREVKKARGVVESVKKVAEMVLVLAAMGNMRGGKVPSEAERELMAEAREKLAEVCEIFPPKDVFPRDAFGGVIEDLGLNKLKEQRLGFRPPKISIAEKLMFSKRKFMMEKAEGFTLPPANSSQRLQGSSGTAVENRGTSHPVRVAFSDKPSHVPISSASLQPDSTLGQVPATSFTSLPYQLPTSEVRPIGSSALPSGHPVKGSSSVTFPRVDQPHFRAIGRENGSPHPTQVQFQGHASGNNTTVRNPTWSMQPQFVSSNQMGSDNKVPIHASKVQGVADVKSGIPLQPATSKPLVTQITTGNPSSVHQSLQGVNHVQAPVVKNTHADIGKIIQKFLQPQPSERPAWTPPSRDYMNKALSCQICQSTVTEVDNVIVCDNCEKGFHLKCLQTVNQKGALRGEWHCLRCLSLSNGKPIPPKYGRVMRNMSTAKMSSDAASVRPSPDRKAETVGEKQKVTDNGKTPVQNGLIGSAGHISSHPISESKLTNVIAMQGNESLSSRGQMGDKFSSRTYPNNTFSTAHVTSSAKSCFEKLSEEKKLADSKPKSLPNSETVPSTSDQSQAPSSLHYKNQVGMPSSIEIPLKQSDENHLVVTDSTEHYGREPSQSNSINEKGDEQEVVRGNAGESATTTSGYSQSAKSSSNHSYVVDWIGDIFQVIDDKTYYRSCRINGVVYRVHDHVLVCFDNRKLIPSKLQAMWEDSKTRMKWVTVNKCYFPSDLPEAVGRPCGLESNEVYESARGSTIMAGLIQGLCDVLPPNKFASEKERRAGLGTVTDDDLRPCYVCKWIYDEIKGLFRDVSC